MMSISHAAAKSINFVLAVRDYERDGASSRIILTPGYEDPAGMDLFSTEKNGFPKKAFYGFVFRCCNADQAG